MGPIRIKATTPAMPSAISSQANQGKPFLGGFPLVCFLAFALLKVSSQGPSSPSSLIHLEQLVEPVIGKTGISDQPGKQAFGHAALMTRNEKRDRSIILLTHDNMATCLIVYILASLPKDFNNLTRLSNRQSHVGSFTYAHTLAFSLISTSMLLKDSQAALNGITTASKSFLPSQL